MVYIALPLIIGFASNSGIYLSIYLFYVTRASFRHKHNKYLRRLLKHQEQVPPCNADYQAEAEAEPGPSCCLGLQLSHGRPDRAQRSTDENGGIAGTITVSLHRAAGKASFVPEVLAGTLLPGPFLLRAEILCPRPFSLEEI